MTQEKFNTNSFRTEEFSNNIFLRYSWMQDDMQLRFTRSAVSLNLPTILGPFYFSFSFINILKRYAWSCYPNYTIFMRVLFFFSQNSMKRLLSLLRNTALSHFPLRYPFSLPTALDNDIYIYICVSCMCVCNFFFCSVEFDVCIKD